MEVIKVKGNTFCIDTGMTYIPFYKINDEEIIMMDTGWKQGEREGIDKVLEHNGFKVSGILCTHSHIDHIGNNAHLKEKYNAIIAMPAYEAHICSSTVNLKLFYSNQNILEIVEHYGHMVCETDIMIENNQDKIYLCGIKFKIIHTPGHSPAHICIVTPDNVAYLGDALISYEVMRGSKLPYCFILREALESKEKLHNLKCSKYIVAHKGIFEDIANLINDNNDFFKEISVKVYNVIIGPMTMEEIMRAVISEFKISVKTIYKYNVLERMLRSYVEYLNETGVIDLVMEDGFLKYIRS
ncbi:glyoxylase-like metal-dependent hydrolase (beta-lactamase superfamily II) [Clostridium punense]|uniref:Glyoxylase-like metal-dependent hydrolase (Beta-lactamase superfamily II) n=1 Tax=Clostridium punense TaxID=1054297 RepID=A0ABS4JZX8_9CLOT|nr:MULTISPECIES: MBL fold metallo-hydrolase [Clostridium]EQB86753.1 hypothetical protein M918_12860 [Clostridium sp. BL8]MBP2020550.1 glyoxylase-like metal-dependent hydrolase (beta-lactamase superfamily II) [Clostridium punense]